MAEVTVKKLLAALWLSLALAATPSPGFAWGREGHQIIALIAEKNMTPTAQALSRQ